MATITGTVTFLFTDVEASTELLQRLGADYGRVLVDHRELVERAVRENAGEIVDARGEEVFAAFSRAADAVGAAEAVQRAHGRGELRVRIGIHTGEPALMELGYLGLDVVRAARICAAGHGRQVLLSQTTRDLVPEAEVRDLGLFVLKGIDEPERLFQLIRPDLASRFAPPRAQPTEPRRLRLPAIRRARPPELAELAWAARARMPAADAGTRTELAALATALFTAAKSVSDAQRFLLGVDRSRLESDLAQYREMGLSSAKAAEQAEVARRHIELLDSVKVLRASLLELAPSANAAAIQAADAQLSRALEQARREIPETSAPLRRTTHRGVYRQGNAFVVPTYDEVGVEHRRLFPTARAAAAFARSERIRRNSQTDYTGPSHRGAADAGTESGGGT